MELLHFHTLRAGVQRNAHPGSGSLLTTMELTLRDQLMSSGLFEEVEVEHTDDPDQLVIGLCQFRPEVSEAAVAAYLESVWSDRVSYPFWSAHSMIVDDEHVELEAATRESVTGGYVTFHLVAQKARIPAQRLPMD